MNLHRNPKFSLFVWHERFEKSRERFSSFFTFEEKTNWALGTIKREKVSSLEMQDCGLPKGKRATTLSIIQCFEKRVEPDARYNRGTIVKVNSPVIVRMAERFTSLLQGKGTRGFYPGILSIFSRSGFMCMTFYRRDGHVVEVQTGSAVSRPEEACSTPHFQQHNIPFLTLVSKYNRIVRIIPLFC